MRVYVITDSAECNQQQQIVEIYVQKIRDMWKFTTTSRVAAAKRDEVKETVITNRHSCQTERVEKELKINSEIAHEGKLRHAQRPNYDDPLPQSVIKQL